LIKLKNKVSSWRREEDNFCCPIRKQHGIDLEEEELAYNNMFGGHRSAISKYFARVSNTIKRFGQPQLLHLKLGRTTRAK
jgi:hypothetical protein